MASAVFGGALRGFGASLVRRTENEREDKLRAEDRAHDTEMELKRQAFQRAGQIRAEIFGAAEADKDRTHQTGENDKTRTFESGQAQAEREHEGAESRRERDHEGSQAEADREHERGMVYDVIPTAEGEDQIITKGGQTRGFGATSRSTTARSGNDDTSEDDARDWNSVIKDYTTTPAATLDNPEPEPVTDWTGAAAEFAQRGKQELAARAAQRASRDPETVDQGTNLLDPPNMDLRGRAQPTAAPTEAPAAGAGEMPEGIPPGARLIGHTRNGAEVYETPNGERLVVE